MHENEHCLAFIQLSTFGWVLQIELLQAAWSLKPLPWRAMRHLIQSFKRISLTQLIAINHYSRQMADSVNVLPEKPTEAPNEAQETHRIAVHVTEHGQGSFDRHLLIPVDDTEDSERTLDWALDNLYKPGDLLHLLHVIPEPTMVHVWAGVYIPPDDDTERLEVETTKVFVRHRFAKALVDKKIPFQLHVIVGTTDSSAVADVIVKKAAALDAECIVMAKHSKGKLKEMFLGSVTAAVSKRASSPVVVIPPPAV